MGDTLLDRALDHAGDAVVVVDRDGVVRGWNPASERLFGHRAAEVIGQDVAVIIPERLREAHDLGFGTAMAQGHLSSDGAPRRTKAVHADGSSIYVVMTFEVVTDEAGDAIGSVAVARAWQGDHEASSVVSQPALDERTLAAELFNQAWDLLDREDRTPDDDDRMVHLAHASLHHWNAVGNDQHRAIGHWQLTRVYTDLGLGDAAVRAAGRCLDYAGRDGVEPWVLASAHEAMARAQLKTGDQAAARTSRDRALAALEAVVDADDKQVVLTDIESLGLDPA